MISWMTKLMFIIRIMELLFSQRKLYNSMKNFQCTVLFVTDKLSTITLKLMVFIIGVIKVNVVFILMRKVIILWYVSHFLIIAITNTLISEA